MPTPDQALDILIDILTGELALPRGPTGEELVKTFPGEVQPGQVGQVAVHHPQVHICMTPLQYELWVDLAQEGSFENLWSSRFG